MRREGEVDPFSGQKAAFLLEAQEPTDSDHARAIQYLQDVRDQARSIAMDSMSSKRKHVEEHSSLSKRPVPDTSALNYSDPDISLAEITAITNELFDGANKRPNESLDARTEKPIDRITALYKEAHTNFKGLEPQHPSECTSLATWKAYTAQNKPIPLDHEDTFRLFKYLIKWCSGQPPQSHYIWAWSLLLRTDDLLSGDEVSILRELCRGLTNHKSQTPLAAAFIQIVGTVFRQQDLLM